MSANASRNLESTASTARAIVFLSGIGIELVHVDSLEGAGFLEDVRVVAGALHYLAGAKACNLLHEAGHVAIVPTRFRHLMNDDVEIGTKEMFEQMEQEGIPPGSREWEIVLQVSEAEATAWSWAAGKAAGIPEELVIEDWCFNGEGSLTRLMLSAGRHYGVNGLAHAGFCRTSNADRRPGQVYPHLNFWLQP
ncbi:hypothetical protein HB746_33680 [Pseudomonas aeruginosa]|uniref:hypothetical protein n=1 Tax=Pseudomonas aeruginosa TaxID=287 RepID=UPI00155F09EA|nr:hypothetical protein [Pseudomonas aeruginosa]EIU2701741.1 hypothetical protein [Pseudomonas aeruginosa]NRC33921.1 hypothetical protein [Pseudomonas aeruginosa]